MKVDRGDLLTCGGLLALALTTDHGWIFGGALVLMGLVASTVQAIDSRRRIRELKRLRERVRRA